MKVVGKNVMGEGEQKKKAIQNNFALLKVLGWSVVLMRAQTFNH